MSIHLNRRSFVQLAAGGALGAAASGVSVRGLNRMNAALAAEDVPIEGGEEAWRLSVCSLCPGGCGLRVRLVGKRVVKVQGNPLHPVNHGGLCPKGLAALQELYHPDRLRTPLRNTGSRQTPRWREISWDEALATLTSKLRELRNAGKAHTVVLVDRNDRSLTSRLLQRFLHAYGSPNYLLMPSGLDALQAAIYLQQGVVKPPAFDWDNTRYLLSFGVNLLEGWGSPASIMRAFGRWRDPSAGRRTKFVQVEPRLSTTAARADEWVPLRPGTEAALALGLAYVLITEGLYDVSYVREHTFGFDDWRDAAGKPHMGFRSLVLSDYRLDEVAALTRVPPETILRLAREMAHNRPAVALGDCQTSTLAGHPYAAMAVHSLNALLGSLGTPGGVLSQAGVPLQGEPDLAVARVDQAGEYPCPSERVALLPKAIASGKPYPVNALLLQDVDPVFSLPNGSAFRRAMADVPFIVTFTPLANETAAQSDLILPAPTALEQWRAVTSPSGFPQAVLSLSEPVVPARHLTRTAAEIVLEIARKLRGKVAAALPFATVEEYLKTQVEEVFRIQTGEVFSKGLEETWNRLLERSGWWAPTYSTAEELWEQMKTRGGWWEPSYSHANGQRVFQTPSHRFEFYSQTLSGWAKSHPGFSASTGLGADDDRLCLPHQPPLEEASADRPLLLRPVEILPMSGGSGAHLPYLQQIAGPHLFQSWESWLEINPETARRLGIADGEMVWIETSRGRAQVRARCYPGAHPDVVYLPVGYGHAAGCEWSRKGVNPLSLLEERYEPLAGLAQAWGTHVRVRRS